jgi:hypothetical protein
MNLPVPTSIYAADVCRDGGTYVLVFQDSHNKQYELELPVLIGSEGRIGYRSPSVKSYESKAVSSLDWVEAEAMARLLMPLVAEPIEWGGVERAEECIRLLTLKGRIA